jgi:radical SAM protein with 4Fe4S-binding SPASM domain
MCKTDINWLLEELSKKDQEDPNVQFFLNGLNKYGYNKPVISPLKVTWDLTKNCNLNCKHCSKDAYENSGTKDLSKENIEKLLLELKQFGIKKVIYSGGEFMTRKDYQDIIDFTVQLGMATSLITNCTLVTKEIARKWKQQGIRMIQTSLDGSIGKTHDEFRGSQGAFEKTLKGIEALVEAKVPVMVAFTISKNNYSELENTINLCLERKITAFTVNDLLPIGRGKELNELLLSNEEYNELVTFFRRKKEELQNKLIMSWEGVGNFKERKPDIKRVLIKGQCGACLNSLHISSNGDITPCNLMQVKCGNIKDQSISDIWDNSLVFKELRNRDLLMGTCGTCDYKYSCGGCRARAYAYTDNYLESDPRCSK